VVATITPLEVLEVLVVAVLEVQTKALLAMELQILALVVVLRVWMLLA
jgi:hypothetical protein